MQATLLGFAIALILALLAALIGPYFVHWNDHRAFFEQEASRLVGLRVRVGGDIEARFLPFPTVTLAGIAIGPEGEASRLTARSLRIEFGLGALMRGEMRAVEMRLVAPAFSLGLNRQGEIDWPSVALAPDTLSIDRLSVEDGRATLTDAASGSRLLLDQMQFEGEVRSLTGPFRGRGFFTTGGVGYGYNVSAGRYGAEGIRLRLALETAEHPVTMESEGLLAFEHAGPRFDGTVTLARPASTVLATGKAVGHEPWKLTGRVKTGAQSAKLTDVTFQYGPHDWGTSLTGTGEFKFGAQPRLDGELSARQLDLDRMLATSDTPRRLPLPAILAFSEMLGGALRPPWPVALGIDIDAVTLGGAPLQGVAAKLHADGGVWQIDSLDFRAPGFTQARLKGRLEPVGRALGFAGEVSLDAGDPKTLVAWLAGSASTGVQLRPWRFKGDVALGADGIAINKLRGEFDRGAIEGRVGYFWPAGNRPARLEAELRAGELDLDSLLAIGQDAASGLKLEWPREATVALDVGRARFAGFEARNAAARLRFDGDGIAIERLSIPDFGNAKIDASGRIQTASAAGDSITVDLDARELNGVIALAEKFAPVLAEPLRRLGGRQKTAKLRAVLGLEGKERGDAHGTLGLTGSIGAIRVNLSAGATGKRDAFAITDLRALGNTDIRLDGQLEADDGGALLAAIGLDRIATGDPRPGRLTVTAQGVRGADLRIEGKLAAGPIEADGKGTWRQAADRPAMLNLDQFGGAIGGNRVQGRLAISFGEMPRIEGALEADSLDAPATVAAAIGLPAQRADSGDAWSTAPFATGASELAGRIEFKAQRATLASALVARQLRGVARFAPASLVFDEVTGEFGNGRLDGRLEFASSAAGLSAGLKLAVSGAEANAMFGEGERPPLVGRVTLQAELAGSGRSPAAFIGSLAGSGSIRLERAQLSGLNPAVFDTVVRAAELGMPIEGNRLREFVTGVLDGSSLQVSRAEAAINVNAGQARFSNIVLRPAGADLEVAANVDLSAATLDAQLTLTGLPVTQGAARPSVLVTLKGALPAPRRSVETGPLTSWLTLRAVEQQSRQIDAMERVGREMAPPSAVRDAPPAPPPARTRETAPAASDPASPMNDAPPLPPPIEIPAAPKPRTAPQTAPRAEGRAPPPASPASRPGLIGSQH